MKNKTFNVEGMECAACSSAIERILKKQLGVHLANVNLTTKKLVVEYNDDMNEEKIIELISKAGFKATNT